MTTLENAYYDPGNSAGFGGVSALKRATNLKRKDIETWLQRQTTYTLHKPARRKYATSKTITRGIDDQMQADLVDMQAMSKHNNGFRYMLTAIDCFSRYAWARPLLSKTGKHVCDAFKDIFEEGRLPRKLQTDKGSEFQNVQVQNMLKQYKIRFFTTDSSFKAALVERFNRTLKAKMWRFFTRV